MVQVQAEGVLHEEGRTPTPSRAPEMTSAATPMCRREGGSWLETSETAVGTLVVMDGVQHKVWPASTSGRTKMALRSAQDDAEAA